METHNTIQRIVFPSTDDQMVLPLRRRLSKNRGITFIEVMVTLAILSLGIVVILNSLVVSLSQIEHLAIRLYATTRLDNRITTVERVLRAYKALPQDLNYKEMIDIGVKEVTFKEFMDVQPVEDFTDIFKVNLSFNWQEGARNKKISRSAYILDFEKKKDP